MRVCHGWRKPGSALCTPTPCSPPGTFAFLSWQLSGAVGTAESTRNGYSWCTAVVTLEMLRLEKQVLLQWADVLSLTPLFSVSSSGGGRQPETNWDFGCGHLSWIQRQECWKSWELSLLRFLSQCADLWAWQKHFDFQLLLQTGKKWTCCSELNVLVWQNCTTSSGLLEGSMWWRHFQHSFCSCSSKWIPGFFSLKW